MNFFWMTILTIFAFIAGDCLAKAIYYEDSFWWYWGFSIGILGILICFLVEIDRRGKI